MQVNVWKLLVVRRRVHFSSHHRFFVPIPPHPLSFLPPPLPVSLSSSFPQLPAFHPFFFFFSLFLSFLFLSSRFLVLPSPAPLFFPNQHTPRSAMVVEVPTQAWTKSANQLAKELESNIEHGLSDAQVEERLKKFGYNELPEKEGARVCVCLMGRWFRVGVWV